MLSKKVKEIMTTDVITTTCDDDVVCAFEKLMKNKISSLFYRIACIYLRLVYTNSCLHC